MASFSSQVDEENPFLHQLFWQEEWIAALPHTLFVKHRKSLERCRDKTDFIAELSKIVGRAAQIEAIRILSRKGYFKQELVDKLVDKGFSEEVAQHAVDEMEGKGYINDRQRAEKIIQRELAKGHGPKYICQLLKHKRVSSSIISALVPLIKESETQSLSTHLTKRSQVSDRKKAVARLLRRGYSYEAIQQALDS
jgi:regulatory protein